MRAILAAATAVAILSTGCARRGTAALVMTGHRPLTKLDKVKRDGSPRPETRRFHFVCSRCGTLLSDPNTRRCPNSARCDAELTPPASYPCPNCPGPNGEPTGECAACALLGQTNQDCYFCGGSGWTLDKVPCVNCEPENHKCPICRGTNHCDLCGGQKTLTTQQLMSFGQEALPQGGAPVGP